MRNIPVETRPVFMFIRLRSFALFISICALVTLTVDAQQDRIGRPIAHSPTVALRGHVPARARAALDQGPVNGSLPLPLITMYFQPSSGQQASLERLLAGQQNPGSTNYHKWLTPEQYADRFGVSPSDINRITAWLQSQGLQVGRVARSRGWIRFSGSAEQVEAALHTEIHQYLENGKLHYANATDPSIPGALSGIVRGFFGLHDFRLRPRYARRNVPAYTAGGQHQIVPGDFATIYDVAPLYSAGINGTGQKLVIVGQTDVNLSDIATFRSMYGLPANPPRQILVEGSPDPGVSPDDVPEANLDLEWSGAVAPEASIIYVNSDDVNASLTQAIDEAYAPVISMSYGLCENEDLIDLAMFQALALQANSQGITWLNAAGDMGAGDCEDQDAVIAQDGLAVDAPGSVPEVTSMGGSEFDEGSGHYWGAANSSTGASALSYIPERVWNDTDIGYGLLGGAGGGGTSIFFPKPVWQTGPGVPSNSYRNVPDISIAASPNHDGYFIYTGGALEIIGGTSIGGPTMAGIVTLLNEYLVSTGAQTQPGLANINPELYRLAQNTSGVFHDIAEGSNSVPCVIGSPDCSNGSFGYSAGAGYDRASGVGSPDAYNLIHAWSGQAASAEAVSAAVVASINQNPVFEQSTDIDTHRWLFTITLSEEAGVAATVTEFTINGKSYDVASVFRTAAIPANGSISSGNLSLTNLAVPTNVVFGYSGTDQHGHHWYEQLSVPFQGPQTPLTVAGASNAASGQQGYAPGMLLSVYGTGLGNAVQSAGTIPLPQYLQGFEAEVNGVTASLYYVSPDQVNLQIPYETQPGYATLTLGNPYANVNYTIRVAPAAPGIFTDNGFVFPPFSSAGRGVESALYITGDGQVTPSLADGTSPSSTTPDAQLPKPVLPVTVTVANLPATVKFIGIPPGLVGVTQINYVVPAAAPLGAQPVVVTVGGVASQAAMLTVTH
jgi:uncharacterized protein (TIGR03437 family)